MFLWDRKKWFLERVIMLMAGSLVTISVLLAWYLSMYWLGLALLIGLMMVVFALTGFCPSAILLHKIGFKSKYQKT